jgi:hypothetical protein
MVAVRSVHDGKIGRGIDQDNGLGGLIGHGESRRVPDADSH